MAHLSSTGRFPYGKLNEHDERETAFAVYRKKDGKVIIIIRVVEMYILPVTRQIHYL